MEVSRLKINGAETRKELIFMHALNWFARRLELVKIFLLMQFSLHRIFSLYLCGWAVEAKQFKAFRSSADVFNNYIDLAGFTYPTNKSNQVKCCSGLTK